MALGEEEFDIFGAKFVGVHDGNSRRTSLARQVKPGVGNSEFNYSKNEKRPDNYIGGPVGRKKGGPFPPFFLPTPPPNFLGLFSAGYSLELPQKRKKGNYSADFFSNSLYYKELVDFEKFLKKLTEICNSLYHKEL
jgi:hypothetical protein